MKRLAGGGAAAVVLVAAGVIAAGGDAPPSRAAEPTAPARATAAVERRDLVDRESVAGTIGYADAGTLGGERRRHADRAA